MLASIPTSIPTSPMADEFPFSPYTSPFPPSAPIPPQPRGTSFTEYQHSASASHPVEPKTAQPEFQPQSEPRTPPEFQTPSEHRTQSESQTPPEFQPPPSAQDFFSQGPQEFEEENPAPIFIAIAVAAVIVIAVVLGIIFWPNGAEQPNSASSDSSAADNLISVEKGGTIESADGASIIIPPGALSEDTAIEIVRSETDTATDRYELKPHGLRFKKLVTVIIPYKENKLAEDETADDIVLRWWKNRNQTQHPLSYIVDFDNKTLRTELIEF